MLLAARDRVDPVKVASIIAGELKEFAKPINHLSHEKCHQVLLKIKENLTLLDNPQRWEKFAEAIDSTIGIINEVSYDFNKFQHLTNLPERSKWLELEYNAVNGIEYSRKELEIHRELFQEGANGVINIWHKQAMRAQQLNVVGEIRKNIRLLNQEITQTIGSFENLGTEQISDSFISANRNIFMLLAACKDSVLTAEKKYSKGTELLTGIDGFYQQANAFRLGEKQDYLNYFEQLKAKSVELEQNSRIIFSSELGYNLTPEQHKAVSIFEERGNITQERIEEIRSAMADWVIDLEQKNPQRGFGRVYSNEELTDFFTKYKADLFRVEVDNKTVGFYILFLDQNNFPPYVNNVLDKLAEAGEDARILRGWTEMMVKTKDSVEIEKNTGINIYDLMHEAVCDTLASHQKEHGYAVVREGQYANLAKKSHLKRGWEETGVILPLGHYEYQVIRLGISPAGRWRI